MKLASHLWQSRHGIFYIRYNFERTEIKRSLKTRDPKVAQKLAYSLNAMNPDDLLKKLKSGQALDWTVKTPGLEISTDGSADDHKNAMQALALILSRQAPAQLQTQTSSKIVQVSLKEAVAEYRAERDSTIKPRTRSAWDSEFNQLTAGIGEKTIVGEINQDTYIKFRKKKIDVLAPSSQDSRNNTYKNFFDWCVERKHIESNPVVALKIGKNMRKTLQAERGREREPYNKDDLNTLFNEKSVQDIKKPCLYWMPLIALFTGARAEEIANIKVDTIKEYESGKYQFTIEASKTHAGVRTIPIHPRLIEAGFLNYIDDVKNTWGKTATLFPYMTPVKYRLTHRFSQDFGNYRRSLGIKTTRDFHSFRTTVIGVLKTNRADAEFRREFVGHESTEKEDTHLKNYASKTKYSMQQLENEIINNLDYKAALDFDLSVTPYTNRFAKYLRSAKIRKASTKRK